MTPPIVTIRPGTAADVPAYAELLLQLGKYANLVQTLTDVDELRNDAFGGQPWYHTFVAETKDKDGKATIVGVSLYHYGYSMSDGRSVHLESLFVSDSVRGQRIGVNLLKEVVRAALRSKCRSFHVRTLESNVRALNLYKSCGSVDITEERRVHLLTMKEPQFSIFANS